MRQRDDETDEMNRYYTRHDLVRVGGETSDGAPQCNNDNDNDNDEARHQRRSGAAQPTECPASAPSPFYNGSSTPPAAQQPDPKDDTPTETAGGGHERQTARRALAGACSAGARTLYCFACRFAASVSMI